MQIGSAIFLLASAYFGVVYVAPFIAAMALAVALTIWFYTFLVYRVLRATVMVLFLLYDGSMKPPWVSTQKNWTQSRTYSTFVRKEWQSLCLRVTLAWNA